MHFAGGVGWGEQIQGFALPLESHLQSILLCFIFWRWVLLNYMPGPVSNHDPPDLSLPSS
jgi:hypothetical protein